MKKALLILLALVLLGTALPAYAGHRGGVTRRPTDDEFIIPRPKPPHAVQPPEAGITVAPCYFSPTRPLPAFRFIVERFAAALLGVNRGLPDWVGY